LGVVLGGRNDAEPVVVTELVQAEPAETLPALVVPGPPVPFTTPAKPDTNATGLVPKPVPPKPAPKPRENAGSDAPRKGDVCYVRGDRHTYFTRSKTRRRYVRDPEDDTCWDCAQKPATSIQVYFKDCSAYRKCSKLQDPAKCLE
jgi:hypothetical protein